MEDKYQELMQLVRQKGTKFVKHQSYMFQQTNSFQDQVDEVKKKLQIIKQNNNDLKNLKEVYQKATTSNEEKQVRERVNMIVSNNQQNNSLVKSLMDKIRLEAKNQKQKDAQSTDTRMKNTLEQALTVSWNNQLNDFQQYQLEFQNGLKDKIKRQTRLVDSTLSEEQVDEICKDPQKANDLLAQQMLGTASVQMQNVISDIQDKYKDIEKIEQSVEQIYQLFQDLGMLVHQQGEMIDNIELSINDAHNYVVDAEDQLIDAKDLHKSARKKQICIACTLIILLLIIILPATLL